MPAFEANIISFQIAGKPCCGGFSNHLSRQGQTEANRELRAEGTMGLQQRPGASPELQVRDVLLDVIQLIHPSLWSLHTEKNGRRRGRICPVCSVCGPLHTFGRLQCRRGGAARKYQ